MTVKRDRHGRCGVCGRTKTEECCQQCHRGVEARYGTYGFYLPPRTQRRQYPRGWIGDQYRGADRD